jgi:hypothetical protein
MGFGSKSARREQLMAELVEPVSTLAVWEKEGVGQLSRSLVLETASELRERLLGMLREMVASYSPERCNVRNILEYVESVARIVELIVELESNTNK